MAHAHHFLERLDRVTREQTEFALELYRDHEAVAYVLQHVNLPAEAGRVALSVEDPREGPFVIVTREGRFVTCLGRGMHHEHPVVPRPQLDALLAKVADKRARRELAQRELRPDEEEENFFQRIVSRGRRFAREDFVAVSSFEAMLGIQPYLVMLELAVEVVGTRAAMVHGAHKVVIKGSSRPAFEKQDRLEWSIAHLMLLSGAADRRELDEILARTREGKISPTFACSAQAGSTFFFRAAWAAARLGKGVLPIYKTAFASAEDWMAILDAGLGLGALGLRHAGLTAEVKRTLQGYEPPPEGSDPNPVAATRATVAKAVLETMENADERTAAVLKIGRDMAVSAGGHLPQGHPQRFDKPEDVPEELARTEILSIDADVHEGAIQTLLFAALPLAARAAAEDFYHPREIVRAWYGQWSPEETLERLKRFARAAPKKESARAEPKPGRNEPCPCGSGKKWKKCHGA
ncbi:MAG TPA: SEC-C metal-binding domain-containing protein [Polyangiaceae bacterium]